MKNNHYQKKYFDWQEKAGKYGAQQDLWMYEDFINDESLVLDFGCGGGYMLNKLSCSKRYGVDVNYFARRKAKKMGLKVYKSLDDIPRNIKFDVIISHHTLEHTHNPHEILQKLLKLLNKKGIFICVVPIDDWRKQNKYDSKNINKHFYTWTPLLLANLFVFSGYKIKEVKIINLTWLPLSRFYYEYIPRIIYNLLSSFWSYITSSRQIRIVATK